jgi:membrane peptidoglycan carboxypeptidase
MHRTIDDPSKSVLRRLWSMLMVCLLAGAVAAALALPAALAIGVGARNVATGFSSLPQAMEATAVPQRTTVLAANGKPMAYFWEENRTDVELNEVSRTMQKAILAIEDYRFYEHGAIDWKGTVRAFLNNAADGSTQGGSSITQQLIKLKLVTAADTKAEAAAATANTYARKLRELRYAMAYERENSKREILRDYLNIAYFGDAAYGIETAAQHYFSVSADELDASQSALLAGIVKNPSAYNPADYPSTALERRNIVLARMAELGHLSQRRADLLARQGLGLDISSDSNGCLSTVGPFFCSYVRSWLLTQPALGKSKPQRAEAIDTGGLVINTTLRPTYQRAADAAVAARVFPTDQAIGGMAMVEPGTGEVRALSQSRPMGDKDDAGETYLNYTVPPKYGNANGFQAGSTFKVFTAATALAEGISPFREYYSPSQLTMQQGSFRDCAGNSPLDWPVGNSTTSGLKNMYAGLSQSVNTFFAQLESDAGLCETVSMARSLGIDVPADDEVGPFTLGVTDTNPLSMAAAYATFAARGEYCEPYPVTSIETTDGETVATFEPRCEQKMDKTVADRMNDMLALVQQPGGYGYENGDTGLPVPSAAKTGTTSESFSVWYMGYTPDLVTSAMIAGANSAGQPQTLIDKTVGGELIDSASGSGVAGPMWKAAMAKIVDKLPGSKFTKPELLRPDPFGDDGSGDDGLGDDGFNDGFGDFEGIQPIEPPTTDGLEGSDGFAEPTEPEDDDAVTYDYERLAGEE